MYITTLPVFAWVLFEPVCGPFQQRPQSLLVAACLTPSEVLRFTLHGRLLGDAAAIQRNIHVTPEAMKIEKLMPAIR
jgi:hypothetical protein